jgi:hypothetical protein
MRISIAPAIVILHAGFGGGANALAPGDQPAGAIRRAATLARKSIVIAASLTYLKETVGVDLRIICSA